MKKLMFFLITSIITFSFIGVSPCEAQQKPRTKGKNPEKELFGNKRRTKVVESRAVVKKKKEQQKREEKVKKEYNKYVKDSRKRAFQIQTPEVQARMKQDRKNIAAREKEREKKTNAATRKAAKKYK
ncbi:MAG TPA: hypothetical protein PLN06_09240 [Bacteroidales bacterium]|nr:hypothetical protein [Bacteroidales bacterium]HQG53089.1 hypothetical protein [Bacteroidales bacterium]HQJ21162.1 hypothetical protein [Bacteroidales bacterium]